MKLKPLNKKAQILGLPFQMIFSIVLIAVFLYVAVVAIKYFMTTSDKLKASNFVVDLRTDFEKAMSTTESSVAQKYALPNSIKQICFTNNPAGMSADYLSRESYKYFDRANYVFFYPDTAAENIGIPQYAKVDCQNTCLNLSSVMNVNPYCINSTNGVVTITVSKEIGKPYLTIK